jgi:hypothetical protein
MPRRLVSCWFGGGGAGDQWPRMARVLAASATAHCPGWSIEVRSIVPGKVSGAITSSYAANTQKLDYWVSVVAAAPDGAEIVLLDADTMVMGPLDAVWDRIFDLAYTRRAPSHPFPINAGVIFVRANARSRAFLTRWRDENRRMLTDHQRHHTWRKQYGGINQAALGCVLQAGGHAAELLELPCNVWNCEDSTWASFSDATRIVHLKSDLRRALFLGASGTPCLVRIAQIWRDWERRAIAAEDTARPPVRPRGRPRGPDTAMVRIPQNLYSLYCRRALAQDVSVTRLIRDVLAAHARRPA